MRLTKEKGSRRRRRRGTGSSDQAPGAAAKAAGVPLTHQPLSRCQQGTGGIRTSKEDPLCSPPRAETGGNKPNKTCTRVSVRKTAPLGRTKPRPKPTRRRSSPAGRRGPPSGVGSPRVTRTGGTTTAQPRPGVWGTPTNWPRSAHGGERPRTVRARAEQEERGVAARPESDGKLTVIGTVPSQGKDPRTERQTGRRTQALNNSQRTGDTGATATQWDEDGPFQKWHQSKWTPRATP